MKLSDRDYKVLKHGLEPYVKMCSVKTLQKFTDSVVPKCESFVCSDTGKTLGKFYPVKDTICISGNMKIQQNIIKENFLL